MYEIVKQVCPIACEAFEDYVLNADKTKEVHIYGNWKDEVNEQYEQIKGVVKFQNKISESSPISVAKIVAWLFEI